MKMKRSYYVFFIVAGILLGFLFSLSVGAKAASKYTVVKEGQPKTVGKYKVSYKYNDGKGMVYCTYKGQKRKIISNTAGFAVMTNGTSIYYAKAYGDCQDGGGITIYKTNMSGTKISKVGMMAYGEGLSAMYGDIIYCECFGYIDDEGLLTRTFNIKTKEIKRITEDTYVTDIAGDYLIMTAITGSPCALPLELYNMKTEKRTLLTTSQWQFEVKDGVLYYLESKERNVDGKGDGKVISYDLKTGKRKTLVRKIRICLEASPITKITPDYMEYGVLNKECTQEKIYRVTYKTGKTELIRKKAV